MKKYLSTFCVLAALSAGTALADPATTTTDTTTTTTPNTVAAPATTTDTSTTQNTATTPTTVNTTNTVTTPSTSTTTTTAATPSNPQKQDAETIKILMVIDDNELNAAKAALKKTKNSAVKKYAEKMEKDHSKNMKATVKIMKDENITPNTSDKSLSLESDGKKEMEKLDTLNDKAFDTAYIEDMINGHTQVLQILDVQLIPNTTNSKLLKQLKDMRKTVEHHLEMAKDTQKQL
jgi:putative membrane protein